MFVISMTLDQLGIGNMRSFPQRRKQHRQHQAVITSNDRFCQKQPAALMEFLSSICAGRINTELSRGMNRLAYHLRRADRRDAILGN
jgi:hypothetical protein